MLQAEITLKQGARRLIRDASDRGVRVLGDPRLPGKACGRVFRDSLPPMPGTTGDLARVQAFFAEQGAGSIRAPRVAEGPNDCRDSLLYCACRRRRNRGRAAAPERPVRR